MSTTPADEDTGTKAIPHFKGADKDYANWATKFSAHAKVKGFKAVMLGTEVPPDTAQATKTTARSSSLSDAMIWDIPI